MKKYNIQLIMLSAQVIPNVLPSIDTNIKPDKIILCESDTMNKLNKAVILANFFKTKNIETETIPLGGAYNFEELQYKFMDVAGLYDNKVMSINLTGGTKLMSIAAQNVFASEGYTCFYSIPNEDKITVITSQPAESYTLSEQIKLNDFFKIHGYDVIKKHTSKNFKVSYSSMLLTRELIQNQNQYEKSISKLNALAAVGEKAYSLKVKCDILDDDESLFQLFEKHGFIKYFDDKKIEFQNNVSRDYCKGIWLEEYIFDQLKELNKQIGLQDYATSVQIQNNDGIKNEFDAVFLHKNNLYIIEAKTAQTDKGTDFIYKLDSLKYKTGIYTKPIIVSLKRLNSADKSRAQELGIKVIEAYNINNLKDKLKEIIN